MVAFLLYFWPHACRVGTICSWSEVLLEGGEDGDSVVASDTPSRRVISGRRIQFDTLDLHLLHFLLVAELL